MMAVRCLVVFAMSLSAATSAVAAAPAALTCDRATSDLQTTAAAFKKLEEARENSGRYPPVAKPPAYHWACRGAPRNAVRDDEEDRALKAYVEKVFLAQEIGLGTQYIVAASAAQGACGGKGANAEVTSQRVGAYLRARLQSAVNDAQAQAGEEKYLGYFPLYRAVSFVEQVQQIMGAGTETGAAETGIATPLLKALLKHQVRLVAERHDLRIPPRTVVALANEAQAIGAEVSPLMRDPKSLVQHLWRFNLDLFNEFSFREGENEMLSVNIKAKASDQLLTLIFVEEIEDRDAKADKRDDLARIVHFEPWEITVQNLHVDYEDAPFVGPATFTTEIDLGFDACDADPAAYLGMTQLASEEDTVLAPGDEGEPPHEETVPSPAYHLLGDLMHNRAEAAQWSGLLGFVIRLGLENESADVVGETVYESIRRDDGATIENRLRVVIKHVPLPVP